MYFCCLSFYAAKRLLPLLRHRKLNERFQNRVKERFPDFSISNGELQTKASASKETEANGFVIVFDPTDAYGAKQIAAKQNAIGILKNKMVLAVDGQATEMNYSLMPADITKKKSYQH